MSLGRSITSPLHPSDDSGDFLPIPAGITRRWVIDWTEEHDGDDVDIEYLVLFEADGTAHAELMSVFARGEIANMLCNAASLLAEWPKTAIEKAKAELEQAIDDMAADAAEARRDA